MAGVSHLVYEFGDYNNFDYWTEFFAHRGYAVLQPNFRGSSGYGADFASAAIGGYGLEMQDDVIDGANWLVEEGIADKEKMCIVGASYGGYAALMATVKTPKVFKCAVSFAGFGDLIDLRSQYRKFVNRKIVQEQIGGENKSLRGRSPINMIGKIEAPILLLHGEDDRVVSVEQSRDMAKKLKAKKKKYKYIELKDGNHYLSKQDHRHALFREMDDFLAKYLQ
ncbi:MAG: prolyl oligopeptidase family serine peptidase [Cellvibrionaceae bacterium]